MSREKSKFETNVLSVARATDAIALFLTTLIGIGVGVWQFAFSPTELSPIAVGVMITLLGLIGLHAAVQRETVQRETNESLESMEASLQDISTRSGARNLYIHTMRRYMKILTLKSQLSHTHPEYGKVVDTLLEDPLRMVDTLADGRLEVSTHLISFVFDRLLHIYQKRHDAVSKNDLNFWLSRTASDYGYRQANYRAAKHTITTRLFIFDEDYFVSPNMERIARVIAEQMEEGIGCALAIHNDFEHEAQTYKALDFALFNSGKAVSFFRGLARDYVVIFRTADLKHDSDLERQLETYYRLLPECWLVTDVFRDHHLATVDPQRLEYLGTATKGRANRLEKLKAATDHPIFPIVVASVDDVPAKLERMLELRRQLRQRSAIGAAAAQ